MPRLLIVHHAPSPGMQAMFEAVLSGTAAEATTAPAARAEP
ncbi:MAG TPA: hypothetical protein VGL63_12865 [Streptosporangiaceae bacterium]|jgi:hypothetical protein